MDPMEVVKKSKGPTVDPALCRACRSIKKCRLMTAEYEWMGTKEVYSDMFIDVFGLLLSQLDGDEKDVCICATCVRRLREASAFRNQVLQSEEIFLDAKLDSKDESITEDLELKVEVKTDDQELNQGYIPDDGDELHCSGFPSPEAPDDDNITSTHAGDHIEQEDKQTVRKVRTRARTLEDKMNKLQDKLDKKLDKPGFLSPEVPDNDNTISTLVADNIDQEEKKTVSKIRTRTRKKTLEDKVNKLKDKLDQKLDKPAQKKKIKQKSKPKQQELDQDLMAYSNTVIIVNNSYVCPFHTRISIYYCFYCKDQFTNPAELREHTLQHNPSPNFENTIENKKVPKIDITRIDCRLCDTKIDDLNTFKNHITNVHGIDVYPVKNEFLKFKLTQHNLKCTECDSTFPYFDSLKKHMVVHFGTLICDVCGACFLERTSLRTHIKSHSKVEVNFPCEVCGKNLKSKYSRYLHVATVHEKRPTINCYKCEASFLSYALRNRHLIEVHADKRTFPCKSCDKVYNRRKTLMEHNRRTHLKIMRHACHLCEQRFYLPSRLKEHLATHTGERNFRCELCARTFPRLQSLQDHIRTHSTSDKKYKCHLCTSAFTQHSNWKNHLKNHHIGYGSANSNFTGAS